MESLVARSKQAGAEILHVVPRVFEKLAFGDRHEGMVAVARTPQPALADLQLSEEPLIAVLEGCEKPGNLGAVLRSADGAGVEALVAAELRTDLYNPNAIRASLGTLFTVPTVAATTADTLAWLRQQRMRIFAARLENACPYTEVDLRGRTAIILGSEAHGLSPQWNSPEVIGIRLPMLGAADSLNVSATAAVLFYEALRQRQHGGSG
ncbi:MAG: RNA methyltransferase [Pirellulaceae bacterium]